MSLKGFIFSFLWIASLLTIGSVFDFSFFDELLCLAVLFFSLRKGFLHSRYLIILLVYTLFHLIISINFGYNINKAILLDALMYAKPFVCAIACGSGFFTLKSGENAILNKVIYVILFILFADCLLAFFTGARDSASSPPFLFVTNYNLAGTTTLMLLFYMFTRKENECGKITLKECFLFVVLLMTVPITMQGKYFGFTFCFIFLKIFCKKMIPFLQSNQFSIRFFYKAFSIIVITLGFLGVMSLALDDLKTYYLTDNEKMARAMMVRSLPKVLEGEYLITGRGFGAFCGPITRIYYPKAFMDEIGLSHVYGLSTSYSNFMADGYLWSFAGCFGLIGIILLLLFLRYMFAPFFELWKLRILPARMAFLCLVCFVWIVIFSFGSGLMFGYGCFVMMLWGMLRWRAVQLLGKETATV